MGVTARGFVSVASVALPETSGGFWVLANFRFCARVFPLLFFFLFSFFFFSLFHHLTGPFCLVGWKKWRKFFTLLSFSWLAFGERRKIYWALAINQIMARFHISNIMKLIFLHWDLNKIPKLSDLRGFRMIQNYFNRFIIWFHPQRFYIYLPKWGPLLKWSELPTSFKSQKI